MDAELEPAERARIRCGTLEVPEVWDRPGGRSLRLQVAIISPERTTSRPPLLKLNGGPGQDSVSGYRNSLANLWGERTMIRIDSVAGRPGRRARPCGRGRSTLAGPMHALHITAHGPVAALRPVEMRAPARSDGPVRVRIGAAG
jgi:hypothetical protein